MRPVPQREKHYFDSNVLIYLVEGDVPYRQRAGHWFERMAQAGQTALTSDLALGECMRGAFRDPDRRSLASYSELFSSPGKLELLPVSRAILELSAEIGAATRTKLADSIHLATAHAHGCTRFVTNDKGIARAPAGLKVILFWDAVG